jgi:hypothetical protein
MIKYFKAKTSNSDLLTSQSSTGLCDFVNPTMDKLDSDRTLKQFTLFPKLPLELRLSIWELALPESRIVTLEPSRSEVDHRHSLRFGKSDKPPVLLQVNHESRSLTLRTYHRFFDSEHLFNRPKYFNNAKDTLHIMGDWVYCGQPWLKNPFAITKDFKKIRHLKMLNGMAYYFLWTSFPKVTMRPMTGSLLKCFPALESFSIQDFKRFDSSSEDVNRNMVNARIQMLLGEVRGFYTSKLDIRRATGDSDEVFEFDVCFTRARDADTRGVLMRGE